MNQKRDAAGLARASAAADRPGLAGLPTRSAPGTAAAGPPWPSGTAGASVPATSEPESCYDRTGLDGTDSESPGPGGRPSPSLLVTPITGCVGT